MALQIAKQDSTGHNIYSFTLTTGKLKVSHLQRDFLIFHATQSIYDADPSKNVKLVPKNRENGHMKNFKCAVINMDDAQTN